MRFTNEVVIPPGQQFTGNEFRTQNQNRGSESMCVRSVMLHMGGEQKTWRIEKVTKSGKRYLLRQSGASGVGADTVTDVYLFGEEAGGTLYLGEQIQVTTTGAASEMSCLIEYEAN